MAEKVKKCKIAVEHKNGKMIMKERGYCDRNNPDKIINRDTETDVEGMMKSMGKMIGKIEEGFE